MKGYQIVLVMLTLILVPLQAQQKYALVIGNGAYTKISPLNNPINDAQDMAAVLQGLGFEVDKVLNANLDQMEEALGRLKNRLSRNQNAYGFFFYAGHGVQSKGYNYLIPADAEIQGESFLQRRALRVQEVLKDMNQAGNALNILVLDACRDNPFTWAQRESRGLGVEGMQPGNSIIVFAASPGAVAAEGIKQKGLFASLLANNLKTPGLEVNELFQRTRAEVSSATGKKQTPAIYSQFFGAAYLGASASAVNPLAAPKAVPQPLPQPIPDSMVRIKGGTFMMGSSALETGRGSDETLHEVRVSSFYMGKYEVTQKEWQEVMGSNPSRFRGERLPVEMVSWYEAIEFCNKKSQREGLIPAYRIDKSQPGDEPVQWVVSWDRSANGYRLPTEAEWEYACRAGTVTPFHTGNQIAGSQANYNGRYPYNTSVQEEYRGKTTEAGSFSPNPWGLYDMHGNVWEWCWDWYGAYPESSATDPMGVSAGSLPVHRGGGWHDDGLDLRSASRSYSSPSYQSGNLGLRLVRSHP